MLNQSMCYFLKYIPAKLHSDLIWNDGALCFIEKVAFWKNNNNNNNNKMSSNMGSVPDPNIFSD